MTKLLVRRRRVSTFSKIWHHIAADNPRTASRVTEKIEQAIRGLLEMPGKGHMRADVKDSQYRFWSVYSWVIAYRYDDESLTVVRVVHGRRNFRRLFRR